MSYQRLVPGSDEPCSYINYYIANGGIIMPIYNDAKADEAAVNQIKSAFSDRKVVCIDGHDIHMGGGNVHCITQQQPKGHL
jgi:agmatine deiminase